MTTASPHERTWSVGGLAAAVGVSVRALHHYEARGLLTPERSAAGHRVYRSEHVALLYRIVALRGLGLSLPEVAATLAGQDLSATVEQHRRRTTEELDRLRRLQRRLDVLAEQLDGTAGQADTPDVGDLLETIEEMAVTVHLTHVYTRLGDDGETVLADRTEVTKDDPRVEAVGAVDELNTTLGLVLAAGTSAPYADWLRQVQNDLFDLGADLSRTGSDGRLSVDDDYVLWLEEALDHVNAGLPSLPSFVVPGGSPAGAHLQHARAVCRRAERRTVSATGSSPDAVKYLNRLSDLLFVLSRAVGTPSSEVLWEPRRERTRIG